MRSRGPDAEGIWRGSNVVLGHQRLAILDLEPRSNQPMLSADGRHCVVFNGEIYNFRELRSELETQGEAFRTTSDTEVLLRLYGRHGEQMLPRLRGMFAFAVWDTESRELFLARDPYGIKPLYYALTKSGFIFASQVKALLASGQIDAEIEPAGLAGFYLWGNVPEPWTLFRGLMAVPAGSYLRVRQGVPDPPVSWHDLHTRWLRNQSHVFREEARERVRHAVTESVRAHLVSDVPVSVFLSGGIDSGVITGLVSQLGAKVEGITIGFQELKESCLDEVPVAASVAAHYGFEHRVRPVTRAEFEEDIARFLDAMDQPTVDGVNTWFASKAAAERGYKVVLSGVGGDELFYGYSLVREIARDTRRNRAIAGIPGARALLKSVVGGLSSPRMHPKVTGIPEFMGSVEGEYYLRRGLFLPHELPALIDPDLARIGLERLGDVPPRIGNPDSLNAEDAVCILDSTLYLRNQLLRDSDWTSMAHSLELRTPLADATLLDALAPIHAHLRHGAGKRMLAKAPAKPLPDSIIGRPKTGFVVPMPQWIADTASRRGSNLSGALAAPGTPWTRRWATVVIDSFAELRSFEGRRAIAV